MSRLKYSVFYSSEMNKTYIPAFGLEYEGRASSDIVQEYVYAHLIKMAFAKKPLPDDNIKNLDLPAKVVYGFVKQDPVSFDVVPVFSKSGMGLSLKSSKSLAFDLAKTDFENLVRSFVKSDVALAEDAAELVLGLERLFVEKGLKLSQVRKSVSELKSISGYYKNKFSIISKKTDFKFEDVSVYNVTGDLLKVVCFYKSSDFEESYLYSLNKKVPPFLIPCNGMEIPTRTKFHVGSWVKFFTKEGVPPIILKDKDLAQSYLKEFMASIG